MHANKLVGNLAMCHVSKVKLEMESTHWVVFCHKLQVQGLLFNKFKWMISRESKSPSVYASSNQYMSCVDIWARF